MKINDAFRFNAKPCKTCGAAFSVFAKYVARLNGPFSPDWPHALHFEYVWEDASGKAYQDSGSDLIFSCACGRNRRAQRVIGTYNAGKKCDGRCLAATGHSCECACKGKNHGAGHEEHA